MESFGTLVRMTRERKGIRAADLAYHIGKDPSYLSRLERDLLKDLPAPDVIVSLSKELGIPEVRLLKALGFLSTEPTPAPDDPRVAEFVDLLPYVDDVVMGALRRMTQGAAGTSMSRHAQSG